MPRNTDAGTYIHVGPEIGVASTKAFTGQVTVLAMLALAVGQLRETVDDNTSSRNSQGTAQYARNHRGNAGVR